MLVVDELFFINLGAYVFPQVHKFWEEHKSKIYNEMKCQGTKRDIAVDGQCDSPGHNATYCTVTAMDTKVNKVVDIECQRS